MHYTRILFITALFLSFSVAAPQNPPAAPGSTTAANTTADNAAKSTPQNNAAKAPLTLLNPKLADVLTNAKGGEAKGPPVIQPQTPMILVVPSDPKGKGPQQSLSGAKDSKSSGDENVGQATSPITVATEPDNGKGNSQTLTQPGAKGDRQPFIITPENPDTGAGATQNISGGDGIQSQGNEGAPAPNSFGVTPPDSPPTDSPPPDSPPPDAAPNSLVSTPPAQANDGSGSAPSPDSFGGSDNTPPPAASDNGGNGTPRSPFGGGGGNDGPRSSFGGGSSWQDSSQQNWDDTGSPWSSSDDQRQQRRPIDPLPTMAVVPTDPSDGNGFGDASIPLSTPDTSSSNVDGNGGDAPREGRDGSSPPSDFATAPPPQDDSAPAGDGGPGDGQGGGPGDSQGGGPNGQNGAPDGSQDRGPSSGPSTDNGQPPANGQQPKGSTTPASGAKKVYLNQDQAPYFENGTASQQSSPDQKVKAKAVTDPLAALPTAVPSPNAKYAARDLPGGVVSKCTVPGTLALTFDDGPSSYTASLLDYLAKEKIKATFFVNGVNYFDIRAPKWALLIARMYQEGHQVGSHGWSHADLATLSADQVRTEMTQLDQAIQHIIGVSPRYMRPPFGSTNEETLKVLRDEMHYQIILWNIETRDSYNNGDVSKDMQAYNDAFTDPQYSQQGYISLQHDPIPTTVSQLTLQAVALARQKGLKFVTVAECLNDKGNEYWAPAK